jgi:hypothetical protein
MIKENPPSPPPNPSMNGFDAGDPLGNQESHPPGPDFDEDMLPPDPDSDGDEDPSPGSDEDSDSSPSSDEERFGTLRKKNSPPPTTKISTSLLISISHLWTTLNLRRPTLNLGLIF